MLSKCAGSELKRELDGWLSKASSSHSPARAIIAPYPQIMKHYTLLVHVLNYQFSNYDLNSYMYLVA